ncbi:MAG TPA: DUF2213 domain-containing protein [Candidatus Binatia bacterium]|nr:DUF2213 domain-containing protein [Candidatus Binatia bacterium]
MLPRDPVEAAIESAMYYRLTHADADVEHTGVMVALVPRAEDAARLALDGGEAAEDLHVTLFHFGDASAMPIEARRDLIDTVRMEASQFTPLLGAAFGAGVFNPTGPTPCLILNIGGEAIEQFHRALWWMLPESPDQHRPWAAHLTLKYLTEKDNVQVFPATEKMVPRMGELVFDRVRVAFAGAAIDIPFATESPEVLAAQRSADVYRATRTLLAARGAAPPAPMPRVVSFRVASAVKVDGDQMTFPVVAAVEGVRRPMGSLGPELVLASQLAAGLDSAQEMPVVFDHPALADGNPEVVSVDDERPFREGTGVRVGTVANARIEGDRMMVDATVSISALRSAGPGSSAIADALLAGQQTEVSVAYAARIVAANSTFGGVAYTGVHMDITFDHLALLPPGVPGACSLGDGCGAART